MKRPPLQLLVLIAGLSLIVSLGGCCCFRKCPCSQVVIITQPQGQTVPLGSDVTFSVYAVGGSPLSTNDLSYQWQFNGKLLDGTNYWTDLAIPGATDYSITITNVQLSEIGFYRVLVSECNAIVSSDPAPVQGETNGVGFITLLGTPTVKTGTKADCPNSCACPGSFVGYVKYLTPHQVVDRKSVATASDAGGRNDSRVEYYGSANDLGCKQASININPVSPPTAPNGPLTPSPYYQFTLYFEQAPVPTTPNPYPLNLINFQ